MNSNLTDQEKHIMFEGGTEAPFSGDLLDENRDGSFVCRNCGQVLFTSDAKFESTEAGLRGWPSFSELAKNDAVKLKEDDSLGMHRTEVTCANCGIHLGHLFEGAGDSPNGKHYCINSTCLLFNPKEASHGK